MVQRIASVSYNYYFFNSVYKVPILLTLCTSIFLNRIVHLFWLILNQLLQQIQIVKNDKFANIFHYFDTKTGTNFLNVVQN